jgi:two-component system, cell cycle response regulator
VNDSHGHLIGSRVLKEFGDLLLASIRSIDTVARYGGDEFTIVLVDTGHETGMEVANRILNAVRDHRFAGDLSLQLTVSIGLASFPRHGTRRESLLASADKAMYLAKSRGRDHVCSADQLEEQS